MELLACPKVEKSILVAPSDSISVPFFFVVLCGDFLRLF